MTSIHAWLAALFINPLGDYRGGWRGRMSGIHIMYNLIYWSSKPFFAFEEQIQISSSNIFVREIIHIPLPLVTFSNNFSNYLAKLLATITEYKITYTAFFPSKHSAQCWGCAHCGEEEFLPELCIHISRRDTISRTKACQRLYIRLLLATDTSGIVSARSYGLRGRVILRQSGHTKESSPAIDPIRNWSLHPGEKSYTHIVPVLPPQSQVLIYVLWLWEGWDMTTDL